uniref:RdRp n=1 Tax=Beihai picobirna-like virus 12 TaxID=1922517 RepID=A0A1L3KL98_9VIRU|nr:RdRp [Beihai picobirna-like virus 12]
MNFSKLRADRLQGLNLSFLDNLAIEYGIDKSAKDKLALNLTRIWLGNNDIYESPFAKSISSKDLFNAFNSEVFEPNLHKLNDVLIDLERSQRDKFGPRSIAKPWLEWKDSFYRSFEGKSPPSMDSKLIEIDPHNLRPTSIATASNKLRNNTSSGLPYMIRKGDCKLRAVKDFSLEESRKYPCVLYTRTQESGKIRGVWGYPISTILLESSYYYPLLSVRRNLLWRSSLRGPESISRNITRLIDDAISNGMICVSIDISQFDASVQPSLSQRAFLEFGSYFQSEYSEYFKVLSDIFVTIPIVTPDGLITGYHGVGSGSNFTNEVDSQVHRNILHDFGIPDSNIDIQGDDGAIICDPDKVNSMLKRYESSGFIVSLDKTYQSTNFFIYLQNLYHVDYRNSDGIIGGIYPIWRALNRIRFQETWSRFEDYGISGKDYYSIRTISILENCKNHPLFEDLVKFVLKYDKYSLDYSEIGLSSYLRFVKETEGDRGDFSNQYGDDISGINSFETVKLIKKLS